MQKFIFIEPERHKLAWAICEAAGLTEPGAVKRIVIDLDYGQPGTVYLQTFADEAILDVDISELGIEISARADDPDSAPVR